MSEPILNSSNNRHTLFPIKHVDLFDLYRKQVECFWDVTEIDFTKDRDIFEKLSSDEQFFIKHILAFFAASDGVVMENLISNFLNEVTLPEARACYSIQCFMENVHSHTYSLLIDTIVRDELEKDKLFNAVNYFPAIKRKNDWALKWIGDLTKSFGSRLVGFACVEAIMFSGSFCAIYWLKNKNVSMNGLTFSNELISRDEALHVETAICIYNKLKTKPNVKEIKEIIMDAVKIEKEFICESLPCRLIGMNATMMSNYIEFVSDRLCIQLGIDKIYNKANPFEFMESISLEGKTNFFEARVSDYALSTKKKTEADFNMDFDF